MTAVVMGANLLAGRLSAGSAARPTLIIGALLVGAGSCALLGANPGTSYGALVAQLVAVGFGLGLIVPIITSALLGSVEPARSGVAAGTLNSARQTGSVLGVAIFGSLAAGRLTHGLHAALIISVSIALAVIALAARLQVREPNPVGSTQ